MLTSKIHSKRSNGQYFTQGNPFSHPAFSDWAGAAKLHQATILEPFAGANNLIIRLQEMGQCISFRSFDITPASPDVDFRDTLKDFPKDFRVCVTNPPWLAKNSATYRDLDFPDTRYDDLYKVALDRCLLNCEWVAALVPESFIRASLFQNRLHDFVSLTANMFEDTGHPVGLALFRPDQVSEVNVWSGYERIGTLSMLEEHRPAPKRFGTPVKFNDPDGNVGLIALDNTREASIRFCEVDELAEYSVKPTGRHITKLAVDGAIRIKEWNDYLRSFREKTQDVLMTCYKGIRKDGMYRRRCDWSLARGIIHHVG